MEDTNGKPTEAESVREDEKAGPITRRRLLQAGGIGLASAVAVTTLDPGSGGTSPDRLEIVAGGSDSVEYSFAARGTIAPVESPEFASAESQERTVTENDDGTVTARGRVESGDSDAFDVTDGVVGLLPKTGEYQLYLNGDRVSRSDLITEQTRRLEIRTPDSSVEYSMTTTDKITEVTNGHLAADGTTDVVEQNDDGTWTVSGLTRSGYGDTYEFVGEVLDFSPMDDEDFTLYLDGTQLTPYDLTGEDRIYDREHSFSFEGEGDTWADCYLEVEDEGRMVASTLDGASIDADYYWISEDGTKAACRVHADDRDSFQFDNLVLDVTIDGTATAYVDGSISDVSRYPLAGATGDGWKGGFAWQEEDTTREPSTDGLALGGGAGYDNIVTSADADYVVQSASGLADALSAASTGEIVFVASDAVIDTGGRSMTVPAGVTLASNRGEDGATGALLYTEETPQIMLRPQANARVTGLRLRGLSPGETVTWQDGISFETPTYAMQVEGADVEVDNCKLWGWPDRAVYVTTQGAHIHRNYILDNNGQGLGYGVSAGAECLIEYNYFHNNRHSVTCAYNAPGYTARYNHFSPVSVMQICDVHDPVQGDTTLESNIIENGETRTWDANAAEGMAGYPNGFDGGSLSVAANWFFDEGSAFDDSFAAVSDSGNVYGGEGSHDPADVIPNHPGLSDRPWT